MAQARKKPVLKLVALEKTITTSVEALKSACDSGSSAVAVITKEKARLLAESKRLGKKKATLLKKKRSASTKLKKAPSADLRKTLKAVEKELGVVTKTLEKTNSEKASIAEELSGLKENLKRATAYMKGVVSADKTLNKPARKRRKARGRRTAAAA